MWRDDLPGDKGIRIVRKDQGRKSKRSVEAPMTPFLLSVSSAASPQVTKAAKHDLWTQAFQRSLESQPQEAKGTWFCPLEVRSPQLCFHWDGDVMVVLLASIWTDCSYRPPLFPTYSCSSPLPPGHTTVCTQGALSTSDLLHSKKVGPWKAFYKTLCNFMSSLLLAPYYYTAFQHLGSALLCIL